MNGLIIFAGAVAAAPIGAVGPASAPPASAPITGTIQVAGAPRQGGVVRGTVPPGTAALTLDGTPVPFARDGAFLVAFDRDAGPDAQLVATRGDGAQISLHLAVAPGNWHIEYIDAPWTGQAATTEEFQRLRSGELQQIDAARAGTGGDTSDGWRQSFLWPVRARPTGRFGSQRVYRGTPGTYHSGVDLAARAGTVYVAPADGVVILAADHPFTLEGNLLMIDHGMGLNSAFLHSTRLLVKVGDVVKQGQPIGIVGRTGRATGPHLHWGMKWGPARIDPASMIGDQ